MPELPDLHVFAINLRAKALHRPIVWADVYGRPGELPPADAFARAVIGHRLTAIERDGKMLRFHLDSHRAFAVHLMLAGRFAWLPLIEVEEAAHKRFALAFAGGEALLLSDPMGKARLLIDPPPEAAPDALSEGFTAAYLMRSARRKAGQPIKALLMDARVVRGIGNAYADEILYRAGIAPLSLAGRIPEAAMQALHAAVGGVLRDSIAEIERLTPDAIAGEERSFLRVHRAGLSETQAGETILRTTLDGRGTYYTAAQTLYL
jgi:formamidopyrimidine-DNA glycosylase